MVEHEIVGPGPGSARRAPAGAAAPPKPACVAACAAPAGLPHATTGTPDQGSSDARHGQEKSGSDDSRSAGTAPTAPSCARSPAHPWPTSGPGSSTPIAPQRTACRSAAPRAHAPGHTPLAAGGPARSPVFCGDFLHHLDLEITLGHQLLEPGVLRLELPQAPDVARLQAPETLAPSVDRLLADPVPLGHRRNRIAVRLADDRDHLLFREPDLCALLPPNREPVSHVIHGPKSLGQITASRKFA